MNRDGELEELLQALRDMKLYSDRKTLIQMVNGFAVEYEATGDLLLPPSIKPKTKQQPTISNIKVTGLSANKSNEYTLSDDQEKALNKLKAWLNSSDEYFILRGYAGTGKTYLLSLFATLGRNIYYSAPTNKATKVLSRSVKRGAKTTYAILGLRMEQKEDKMILTPIENVPYFPRGSILVVDEASMVGKELDKAVEKARERCDLKVLFVGDPLQLPPVGERKSSVWSRTKKSSCRATLRVVVRHDNQILTLATKLRSRIKHKNWVSPVKDDHKKTGVFKLRDQEEFEKNIKRINSVEAALKSKVIAWRNKTVDYYNNLIRSNLGFKGMYCVGDLVLIAEPVERDGAIIATIDDEFIIEEMQDTIVKIDNETEVDCWQIYLKSEDKKSIEVVIAKDRNYIDRILFHKAKAARLEKFNKKQAWSEFWRIKSMFNNIRYGYAITAHRSQGSTLLDVYVDQTDILANKNKLEAFKCLYVAFTRAGRSAYTY